MDCSLASVCGGCSLRHLDEKEYRQRKCAVVQKALQSITRQDFVFSEPVFIKEGCRRRASFAFRRAGGGIVLGFNAYRSNEIVDLPGCPQLTPALNRGLEFFRGLLSELCRVPLTVKEGRKGRAKTVYVEKGDLWLTEADNGLDALLEFDRPLNLELREIIFERVSAAADVVRVSHRFAPDRPAETILEKGRPYIEAGGVGVFIPAGTFLQPSKEGQAALTALVLKYLGKTSGKIADLFCGVGTFSYPLAQKPGNRVLAVDASKELLEGFKNSVNRQMIANIEIVCRNLFKYPLEGAELEGLAAVVFDPPRAGAKEQAARLAALPAGKRPRKLIAVSCNPETFARDAEILQNGGYRLCEVTPVDQFVYTSHCELVALFVDEGLL